MKKINFKALISTTITFLKGVNVKTWIAVAATAAVATTGIVVGVSLSGHEHEFGEWVVTQEATCAQTGLQVRTCECSEEETQSIPAIGHASGDWSVDVEPTCTVDGSKHQVCSVCNETIKTETLPATGHTDGEWKTDANATCTEDGSKHQVCAVCNETIKTEVIPATGHTDGEWITDADATCTVDGSKHQVCSVCNETIDTETLPATGHTDGEWKTDANATCTEDGSKHQVCSVCNATIKTEVIPATGHTDGEWITDAEATCTVDGSKHQVCSVCNETIKTEILPATGHTDGEWITDTEETCTVDGSKHQVCSVCNETIKTEVISATGHNYRETLTSKTCITNSKLTYTCSACNDTYDKAIPEITVSFVHTGTSSSTMNGYGRFSKGYRIDIYGGYGSIQAVLELYTSETAVNPTDVLNVTYRSIDYSVSYNGYADTSDVYRTKIIVMDEAGNSIEYEISLRDLSVISKNILAGECEEVIAVDDITKRNLYGFGKYTCNACNRVLYKDCDGNELEVADLVLSRDGTAIMSCNNIDTAELLIIPDTVTSVADSGLFVYRANLKHILFGNQYMEIRLQGSPIEHIYIPSHIGAWLPYCSKLKTVIWADGVEKVNTYGNAECVGRTLWGSSVQNIIVPVSIEFIGSGVFEDATKLTAVYYMGTAEEWNNINIEKANNMFLLEATRYYYTETHPTAIGNYWHYVDGVPTPW